MVDFESQYRVLLIEDDEDDFILMRNLLFEAVDSRFEVQWLRSYSEALEAIRRCDFDVTLLDCHLGDYNGLELLREVDAGNCDAPFILLTGPGEYVANVKALKDGATDYLLKSQITPELLEKTILYAIERKRADRQLKGYHDHLEELVAERTAQLEEANEKLRREIAERERADAARRQSEERYRLLAESAQDIIYTVRADGTLTSVNPAFEQITGWSAREWIGRRFEPLVHPDDLPTVLQRFRLFMKGGKSPPVELRIRSKSGDYITLELTTTPRIRKGKVTGVHGVARDITERKRSEEKLVRQNHFLNAVLESLTHPFYVVDANDHTIKMANSAARRGKAPGGIPCYKWSHQRDDPCGDDPDHLCPLLLTKERKEPVSVVHIDHDEAGNPRFTEVHAYPIFDAAGNVAEVIEYLLDITERKELEEVLRSNAEKIKLFAYSVSHDLKSPVVGINGLTRLLHKHYRDVLDERGRNYCDQILKASEQVVILVEQINLYVRTKEHMSRFEWVAPKEVIGAIRDEFGALLGLRGIGWREPVEIPKIRADRMSLVRVFRNLVENALKYGGEDLTEIRIGYEDSTEFHCFSVKDDGRGVAEADCERIFDLFQRNCSSRGIEGAGLGLAIVKEIAAQHGGSVYAEPGAEGGAVFRFTISKKL